MSDSRVGSIGIEVECDTAQVDEAIGKLEQFSELTSDLAPMVSIHNCRNCTFNIYPSRNTWAEIAGEDA